MDSMEAEDPSGGLPEELIMPGRVSVMMRARKSATFEIKLIQLTNCASTSG